jgi:hypothetical protein
VQYGGDGGIDVFVHGGSPGKDAPSSLSAGALVDG